jgi:hypothetical protein
MDILAEEACIHWCALVGLCVFVWTSKVEMQSVIKVVGMICSGNLSVSCLFPLPHFTFCLDHHDGSHRWGYAPFDFFINELLDDKGG